MNASDLWRDNQTAILKGMASKGQARIAEVVGVSESTISRFKDNDIERIAAVLAAAGLKVVPENSPTIDADRLHAITILAREALNGAGWQV